jgi:hypothetical protein
MSVDGSFTLQAFSNADIRLSGAKHPHTWKNKKEIKKVLKNHSFF